MSEHTDKEPQPRTPPIASTDQTNGRRTKLLFLELPGVSDGGFLDHIVRDLAGTYEVKYLKSASLPEIRRWVDWSEVIWLEWANEMAVAVTNELARKLRTRPVLCRLHGYEAFTKTPSKINWNLVDRLVFVARHKQEIFDQYNPGIGVRRTVIRNGVDTSRFSVPPDKKNTRHLLLIGHLNARKGLPMLVQSYHQLLKRDDSFQLTVRGKWQDPKYRLGVMTMVDELKLREKIHFEENWIDDLDAWMADKSHILSFSLEESFHYTIGNSMAAGLKPIIHAWRESREIWPEKYIFNDIEGFVQAALDTDYHPETYRQELFDHGLTADRQVHQIDELIREVMAEQSPASAGSSRMTGQASDATPLPNVHTSKTASDKKKHVMIVTLRRSGSTVFWRTFRQDQRLLCFDEPFRGNIGRQIAKGQDDQYGAMGEYLEYAGPVSKYWKTVPLRAELSDSLTGPQKTYLHELMQLEENVCMDFVRCCRKVAALREAFPSALLIHLMRDPRAFATSHLRPYGKWVHPDAEKDLLSYEGWFDFWEYQTLAQIMGLEGTSCEKLMGIWKHMNDAAAAAGPDLTVRFEQFASNPEPVMRTIYDHLELEYPDFDYSGIHAPNPPAMADDPRWIESCRRCGIPVEDLYAGWARSVSA